MNKVITIKEENIASHFYLIRGEKIILDYDLAMLYGVETGALKQAVKRNIKRFPGRFHAYFNRRRIKQLGITKCDTIQKLSWGRIEAEANPSQHNPICNQQRGEKYKNGVRVANPQKDG